MGLFKIFKNDEVKKLEDKVRQYYLTCVKIVDILGLINPDPEIRQYGQKHLDFLEGHYSDCMEKFREDYDEVILFTRPNAAEPTIIYHDSDLVRAIKDMKAAKDMEGESNRKLQDQIKQQQVENLQQADRAAE